MPRVECPEGCKHREKHPKHRHHKCGVCGKSRPVGFTAPPKLKPDWTDRQFMYELVEPKTGDQLKATLYKKWGTWPVWRRRTIDPMKKRVRAWYRLKIYRMLRRLQWLEKEGYVRWENRLVPRRELWREYYVRRRFYALTQKGAEYIGEWIEKCHF